MVRPSPFNMQPNLRRCAGLATGAGVSFEDILALNVRTEIAYGLASPETSSDGCTALAYYPTGQAPYLAQNWDWEARQAPNLIHLTVHQSSPKSSIIEMITEAGIIGKIGLTSSGLGVCLNAVRAPGVSHEKLPVHLALRAALDADPRRMTPHGTAKRTEQTGQINGAAHSGKSAVNGATMQAKRASSMLQRIGVASAAHILIADTREAIGLETSCEDTAIIAPIATQKGVLVPHTNHFVNPHGVSDKERQWKDSAPRLARIEKLVRQSEKEGQTVDHKLVSEWLLDEEGYPVSICRDRWEKSDAMTLFSIVMNLREKTAVVRMGRQATGAPTVKLDARNVE
jgi:isopenicillin-N N-acyltransferase like protein